jgi:xanthine dehydrogenase accessory factor
LILVLLVYATHYFDTRQQRCRLSGRLYTTTLKVGDMVSAGQEVARVDAIPLHAPIDGMLRGLTHDIVPVAKKTKVIEVDPRGAQAQIAGIAERPLCIAQGVLEAIKTWAYITGCQ